MSSSITCAGGSRTKTIRFPRSTFQEYVAEYSRLVATANAGGAALEAWLKSKKEYLDMITEVRNICLHEALLLLT